MGGLVGGVSGALCDVGFHNVWCVAMARFPRGVHVPTHKGPNLLMQ